MVRRCNTGVWHGLVSWSGKRYDTGSRRVFTVRQRLQSWVQPRVVSAARFPRVTRPFKSIHSKSGSRNVAVIQPSFTGLCANVTGNDDSTEPRLFTGKSFLFPYIARLLSYIT